MLASGQFLSTILRRPLWGYLLSIPAVIYDHPFAGRVFATIIGSITPVLVYLAATRLFNKRTGFVAGLLFAFYPEHICYSHYLWSEILLTPLIVLSVYFFALFAKDRQQNKYLFLSFIIAGFGLL